MMQPPSPIPQVGAVQQWARDTDSVWVAAVFPLGFLLTTETASALPRMSPTPAFPTQQEEHFVLDVAKRG